MTRNSSTEQHGSGNEGNENVPVTVIGLGAMGFALASAFVDGGHPTTVWNRSAGKADALVSRGAILAPTAAEAIAASSIVVICLLDYRVVMEVLESSAEKLAGKVIVNLTNGTPEQARLTENWVNRHGADYLDGGIMAVPPLISKPEAVLLYSGSQEAYQNYLPTLGRLGTARYLGTDPGLAALHDLALLSGMYGMFGGFLHAVALVGSEGFEASEFTSSLLIPWLHSMITIMPEMARQIDTLDYATAVASLEMQASNDTIREVSIAQGINTALMDPLFELMKQRVAEGYGSHDFPSVIELIRKPVTQGTPR